MSVVAAYGMLAYRLASHTGSEVTFNPTFFFYFSIFRPFLNELNSSISFLVLWSCLSFPDVPCKEGASQETGWDW